jgi:glycerate kinase
VARHASVVVLAPDSFKGSIRAAAACDALAAGWRDVEPDARVLARPMADGGEGTLDAFAAVVPGARRMPVTVTDPAGRAKDAEWLLLPPTADAPGGTGVVELASTSGIEMLGRFRLAWESHTVGFGQAIAAALRHGVSRLILGVGSSASTEGGAGMLVAMGARFRDAAGSIIPPGVRGLAQIETVDVSGLSPLPPGGVRVLTDVTNPLLGPAGAAAVFGPQKGLAAEDAPEADAALAHYAAALAEALPAADPAAAGAGAAGGTGFALQAWGAQLLPGAAQVADVIGLPDALADASVVVTGEGSFDGQSAAGKVPALVAALAAEADVPVALVAGRIAKDADAAAFTETVSLTEMAGGAEAAQADPAYWLRGAGQALAERFAGI